MSTKITITITTTDDKAIMLMTLNLLLEKGLGSLYENKHPIDWLEIYALEGFQTLIDYLTDMAPIIRWFGIAELGHWKSDEDLTRGFRALLDCVATQELERWAI